MFRARLFSLSFGLGVGFGGGFFEYGGEERDESGADEDAAHNVGEPVDAGEETTKGDDEGEKRNGEVDDGGEFGFDVVTSEENGRAGKSESEEDVRGGVGRL